MICAGPPAVGAAPCRPARPPAAGGPDEAWAAALLTCPAGPAAATRTHAGAFALLSRPASGEWGSWSQWDPFERTTPGQVAGAPRAETPPPHVDSFAEPGSWEWSLGSTAPLDATRAGPQGGAGAPHSTAEDTDRDPNRDAWAGGRLSPGKQQQLWGSQGVGFTPGGTVRQDAGATRVTSRNTGKK